MKRRFDFRLERLLRVRAIEERVARAEWGQTETLARAQEQLRDERARKLASSRQELAASMGPGSTLRPEWMLQAEQALAAQVVDLRHRHEDALTLRAQADTLGRVWQERERDRSVLEELEGRARTDHREELERWDNAQLDEQALMRRTAQQSRGGIRRRREEDSSSNDLPTDH